MKDLTPILKSNDEIVDGIHYRLMTDSELDSPIHGKWHLYYIFNNDLTKSWMTSEVPSPPHYVIIDMGRYIDLSKVSIYPCNDVIDIIFKNFEIFVSDDNAKYIKVFTGLYPDNNVSGSHFLDCEIKSIKCRYIKINIIDGYNTRPSYKWLGINEIKIYGEEYLYYMNNKQNEDFVYDDTIKLILNTEDDIKKKALPLNIISDQYIEKEKNNDIKIKKMKGI